MVQTAHSGVGISAVTAARANGDSSKFNPKRSDIKDHPASKNK